MKHFALIGRSLGHSHSKLLFDGQHFADADYRLQELDSVEGVRDWVAREGIAGFNVTNPFKQSILSQLDTVDDEATRIGAVNCVSVEGGRLAGHNTDCPAFDATLPPLPSATMGVVLGTGGASDAVVYCLKNRGIQALRVSRTPKLHPGSISYEEAHEVLRCSQTALLVNATPVGTYPDTAQSPWPWPDELHAGCMVYDLVYNPSPTLLLRQAAAHGCTTQDGTAMLQRQAMLSWQWWRLAESPQE